MPDKTVDERDLDRAGVAESLRALADEFESGGNIHVRVGNAAVDLQPSDTVSYEVCVRRTDSLLRRRRETVTITLDWRRP